MRDTAIIAAFVALLMGAAGPASAHAFLDHAEPAVGATLDASPARLRLWFTEPLKRAGSMVRVLDRNGAAVDKGDVRLGGADKRRLEVSLPALMPGTYKVIWRVLSEDAHVSEGDFTFEVAP